MRYAIVALIAVTLAGCGVAARNNAREVYDQSREAYKACLARANSVSQCEPQRAAMEADRQAFENIWPAEDNTVVFMPQPVRFGR